jgi:type II secretory pathway component PulF
MTTDPSFPAAQAQPPPREPFSGLPFAVTFVALHALLCGALAVILLTVVARAERLFRDFNMELPGSTIAVLATGRWFANYWYVVPPFFLLWLVLAAVLLTVLHRRRRWVLAALLALLLLVLPLLAGAFALIAVQSGMTKLLEGLSE